MFNPRPLTSHPVDVAVAVGEDAELPNASAGAALENKLEKEKTIPNATAVSALRTRTSSAPAPVDVAHGRSDDSGGSPRTAQPHLVNSSPMWGVDAAETTTTPRHAEAPRYFLETLDVILGVMVTRVETTTRGLVTACVAGNAARANVVSIMVEQTRVSARGAMFRTPLFARQAHFWPKTCLSADKCTQS